MVRPKTHSGFPRKQKYCILAWQTIELCIYIYIYTCIICASKKYRKLGKHQSSTSPIDLYLINPHSPFILNIPFKWSQSYQSSVFLFPTSTMVIIGGVSYESAKRFAIFHHPKTHQQPIKTPNKNRQRPIHQQLHQPFHTIQSKHPSFPPPKNPLKKPSVFPHPPGFSHGNPPGRPRSGSSRASSRGSSRGAALAPRCAPLPEPQNGRRRRPFWVTDSPRVQCLANVRGYQWIRNGDGYVWVCLKMGYTPNEIAI